MTTTLTTLDHIADTAYRLYHRRDASLETQAALRAVFAAAKQRGIIAPTADVRREGLPDIQNRARAQERLLEALYLKRVH